MILLHLKKCEDEPNTALPEWYFLIGVIYDQAGVAFYVHYPKYVKEEGWKFVSQLIDDRFLTIFEDSAPNSNITMEGNCVAAILLVVHLLAMQHHTDFVRKRLVDIFDEVREKTQSLQAAFPEIFAVQDKKYGVDA